MFYLILDVFGRTVAKRRSVFASPLKDLMVKVVGCTVGFFVGDVGVGGDVI
jgi:hypothetical protein